MAIDSSAAPPASPEQIEQFKQRCAAAAAALVEDHMRVGLGTGSTVAHLLPQLAHRQLPNIRCVATSPHTAEQAGRLGLRICTLEEVHGHLDIAIDGADQIDEDGWLIKGAGAAHTREKIVAAASSRFIVIVSAEKLVRRLSPPVPLELLSFGISATLEALSPAKLRSVPLSPDGNLIADHLGEIDDPARLAHRLSSTPGVVEHGLFAPTMVSEIIVGCEGGVRRLPGGSRRGAR